MNDLQKFNSSVPVNIQEIVNEVLIGREKLNAIRAAIKAAKKVNKPTYDAMKAEGREYGERVLDYELMLSNFFNSIPKTSGGDRKSEKIKSCSSATFDKSAKEQVIYDMGFDKTEAHRISQLTPDAVQKAKTAARENNDIPTRSLAIQLAKKDKKEQSLEQTNPEKYTWKYIYDNRWNYANDQMMLVQFMENYLDKVDDEKKIEICKKGIKLFKRIAAELRN